MAFDWPIDRTVLDAAVPLPPTDDDTYAVKLAQRNGAEDLAVSVLFALSGRQFGVRDVTVRPCRAEQSFGMGSVGRGLAYRDGIYGGLGSVFWSMFVWNDGDWLLDGAGCGCMGGQCRISGPRMIHLPGPAQAVTAVTVNGSVLDPSTYTLQGNRLYRTGAIWPYQDLSRPAGENGTWTVDYKRGIPVPAGVDMLTGQLALEMLNAVNNSNKCRLPRNVVAVSRNGVSYQVYDPTTFYAAGKTGLPEIDLWLMGVNPNHLQQAPSVR